MRRRLHRIRTSPFARDLKLHGFQIGLISTVPIALALNLALRDFVWIA